MMVLGGVAVSYEQGDPVGEGATPRSWVLREAAGWKQRL